MSIELPLPMFHLTHSFPQSKKRGDILSMVLSLFSDGLCGRKHSAHSKGLGINKGVVLPSSLSRGVLLIENSSPCSADFYPRRPSLQRRHPPLLCCPAFCQSERIRHISTIILNMTVCQGRCIMCNNSTIRTTSSMTMTPGCCFCTFLQI